MRRILTVIALLLSGVTPAATGFMDESNCKSPPFASIGSGLAGHVNSLGDQLVACVNWMMDREVENHNKQQELLREMFDRINSMEDRIRLLESR